MGFAGFLRLLSAKKGEIAMLKYLNKLAILNAEVGALLCGVSPAHALITIELKEGALDSGPIALTPGGVANPTITTFGDYSVNITSRSSSPGVDPTIGQALLQHSDLEIDTIAVPTAPLEIILMDDGFVNNFGSPVLFEGNISAVFISPGDSVSTSHALNGTTLITDLTLTGGAGGVPVPDHDFETVQTPLGPGMFSMSNDTFVDLHGTAPGASAQFTVTTEVSPVVPAPAGIVLALTGLPCLGLGTWFRRRKAKVVG
jgi:hypothetical protein